MIGHSLGRIGGKRRRTLVPIGGHEHDKDRGVEDQVAEDLPHDSVDRGVVLCLARLACTQCKVCYININTIIRMPCYAIFSEEPTIIY